MRVTILNKDIKNAVKAIKPFISKDNSIIESSVLFNIAENGNTLILRYGAMFQKKVYLDMVEAWGDTNAINRFNALNLNMQLGNAEAIIKNTKGDVSIAWDIVSYDGGFTELADKAKIIADGRETTIGFTFKFEGYIELFEGMEKLYSINVKYNRAEAVAMTYFADLQKLILRDNYGLEAFDFDLGEADFSFDFSPIKKAVINRGIEVYRNGDKFIALMSNAESKTLRAEKDFEYLKQFIHNGEYQFKISTESLKDIKKHMGIFSKDYGIIYYSDELESLVYSERDADGSIFEFGIDMQGDWDKENYLALSMVNLKTLIESGGEFNYNADDIKIYTRGGALVKRADIIHFKDMSNPYYVSTEARTEAEVLNAIVEQADEVLIEAGLAPLAVVESFADITRQINKLSAQTTKMANDYGKLCKMFGEYAKFFEIGVSRVEFGNYNICLRQSIDSSKEALAVFATLGAISSGYGAVLHNGTRTDVFGFYFNVMSKNNSLVELGVSHCNGRYSLRRSGKSLVNMVTKDELLETLRNAIDKINGGGDEFMEAFNKCFDKFMLTDETMDNAESEVAKYEKTLGHTEAEVSAETMEATEPLAQTQTETKAEVSIETEAEVKTEVSAETKANIKYSEVDLEKLSEFVVDCYNNLGDGLSYKAYKEAWASIDWGVNMGAKAIIEMTCYKYKNHAMALQNIIKGYTDLESKCYDYNMWQQCIDITSKLIVAIAEVFLNFLETEAKAETEADTNTEAECTCYAVTNYINNNADEELNLVEKTTRLLNLLKVERVLGYIRGNANSYSMGYAYG